MTPACHTVESPIDPHRLSIIAALGTAALGLASLTIGALGLRDLGAVASALDQTNERSALGLILLGLALAVIAGGRGRSWTRAVGCYLASLVAVGAIASLAEQALDFDLASIGVTLPWPVRPPQAASRLSPATAGGFLLLSGGLLLLPYRNSWARRLVQAFVLGTLLIAALALVEYAYGFDSFDAVAPHLAVTVCLASTFLVLSLAVLYSRRDFEIMLPIRSPQMGGLLARQMLPAVLGIPLLLGWVRLVEVRQLGENGFEIGLTIHTLTTIVVFGVLVWLTARSMNDLDLQRVEARHAEQEMRALSEACPLTGSLNRRSLDDRLEREWSRASRSGRPLSAIMLDVDRFKQINDAHGHAAGDAILKRLATILMEECRPTDLVCRYGGDEFCVLVPDATEDRAACLAERLCAELENSQVYVNGQFLTLTGSFGVAERSADMASGDQLIDRADQALLAAKQAGRNRVARASRLAPQDTPERHPCLTADAES